MSSPPYQSRIKGTLLILQFDCTKGNLLAVFQPHIRSLLHLSIQQTNSFRSTVNDFVSFNLTTAESVADHPKFNSKRQSMIFIHGWLQSPDSPVSEILLKAYLENGTFNILALDWSKASSHLILDVVAQRAEPV